MTAGLIANIMITVILGAIASFFIFIVVIMYKEALDQIGKIISLFMFVPISIILLVIVGAWIT